jgi:hypothetical protein
LGNNSIFIVFSNIWPSVRLKITPQFQASWNNRLFTLDMGSLKKNDSFYLSIAVLPVFLYLISANNSVLLLYAYVHKISLKYLFPEKITIEICSQKGQATVSLK